MTDEANPQETQNSLTGLFSGMVSGVGALSQLSQTTTQYLNLRYYLISNDRSLLSHMYVEHGIVQTLVDQPVDDAFREGYIIQTENLDEDDIRKVESYMERHRITETIKQALKWARLYGGGAIMIVTDQKPDTPLDMNQIKETTNLDFKSVDMWELLGTDLQPVGADYIEPEHYMYYGKKVHKSRIYRINGKEAPSFLRRRMRGWGMSELEKLVRSINQYMKNQDVVFELMDEAKVDVYKIDQFNSALSTEGGTQGVQTRIQLANQIKNFQNAIVMDTKDEYDQKQMSFTGLSEVLKQIREGIAADLKMPVTKLFGISSAGFNSGEDDIENYNAMIEGEIRSKCKYVVVDILTLVMKKLFNEAPEDMYIEFPELRMMSTEQQEIAKTNEYNRVVSSYQTGLINGKEAKQALNKSDLLPVLIQEDDITYEPSGQDDAIVSDTSVE